MNESESAWVAGIFEGEGTVYQSGRASPQASVTMTDEDIIQKWADLTGARVAGPYQYREGTKPFWRAGLWGWEPLADLYATMRPWLGSRRTAKFEEVLSGRPIKVVDTSSCGNTTPASGVGKVRHQRRGEATCGTCKAAAAEYARLRRA